MNYSWNQPCCSRCFDLLNPGRHPVRVKRESLERKDETCVICGYSTKLSGIYIRISPKIAPHPTTLKDE